MVTCWISSSTGPTAAGCGGWWRAGALQRAANGLRCLIADHQESEPAGRVPRARAGAARSPEVLGNPWDRWSPEEAAALDPDERREPVGTETGRGLWLAAQLADELSITAGPDHTTVSLFIRFE